MPLFLSVLRLQYKYPFNQERMSQASQPGETCRSRASARWHITCARACTPLQRSREGIQPSFPHSNAVLANQNL